MTTQNDMTSDATYNPGLIKSSHYLYLVYPKNSGQINSYSWKKKATDSPKTFKLTVKFLKITFKYQGMWKSAGWTGHLPRFEQKGFSSSTTAASKLSLLYIRICLKHFQANSAYGNNMHLRHFLPTVKHFLKKM